MSAHSRAVGKDLTQGSILPQLLSFAMPILLTNLLQQLYNAVDLAVIGQFGGSTGTVGVSTGGEIANLLTFVCMGLASAGEVYVSQLAGAKEHRKLRYAIGTLLATMLLVSTVFMIGSLAFCEPLLKLINTPEAAFAEARDYMLITAFGMPFIFGYNAICSTLRGMGESKRPLEFIIVATVVNIVLDVLFVAVFHMGAAGTAYATVIAQIASCMAAFVFFYRNRAGFQFDFKWSSFAIRKEPLMILLKLGIPKVVQQVCIHMTQLYCNARVNDYGLVESAVNSVGNKVVRLVNIMTASIDTGAAVMVGQNLSAQKYDRVKKVIYWALGLGGCICVMNCTLALAAPEFLFGIFSKDPAVIEYGVVFMQVAVCTFILAVPHGAFGAVITGSGNAMLSLMIGLLDGIILRLVISLTFSETLGMGVVGYFYGNSLPRIAPAVIGAVYFFSGKWKTRKLLTEE